MRNYIENIISAVLAMVILFTIIITIWVFAPMTAHAHMTQEAYAYAEEVNNNEAPEEFFHIVDFDNGTRDYAIHTDYDAKEDVWQFTLYYGGLYVTSVIPSNRVTVIGACGVVTPQDWLNGDYDGHDCPQ
jgi:hypothetical protein